MHFDAPFEVCGFRVTATTRCPTHCHFCVIFVALKAPWVHAPQLDPPGALGPGFSTSRGPSKSREIRCMNFEWIFSPPPTSVCMNFSPLQMTHKIQVSRRGEKFIPGWGSFIERKIIDLQLAPLVSKNVTDHRMGIQSNSWVLVLMRTK